MLPFLPAIFATRFTLTEAGSPEIELDGVDATHNFKFTLPPAQVVRTTNFHIGYTFSPALIPQLSHLKLLMNGTLFATIQPAPGQFGGSNSHAAEADFSIPSELLAHNNTLDHRVHRPLHYGL